MVTFLLLAGGPVTAQDRVTHTPEGASKPVTEHGEILDFTGTHLTLRGGVNTVRIPSQRVKQIETGYQPEHLKALEHFQRGETREALPLLRRAVEREPRAWVDRELTALIVQADLRLEDLGNAVRDFRFILQTDLETRHWGLAPLIWSPQLVSDTLKSEMVPVLTTGNPGEQLLAASLLLMDPAHGEAAERKLNALSRDLHPVISGYAKAQLWRLQLASRQVHETTLQSWWDDINRLPQDLRPGPQYLYALGFEIRGEARACASEALWLPFVYSNNEPLAARGFFTAAENLQRTGLNTEAGNLYRELIVRYPWSRDAALARTRLVDQATPPSGRESP